MTSSDILRTLMFDPRWKGVLGYDAFAAQIIMSDNPVGHAGPVTADSMAAIGAWLRDTYPPAKPTPAEVAEAVEEVASMNSYHPVRDALARTVWDGRSRIGSPATPTRGGEVSWLTTYFGAEDSDALRTFGRMWLVSAIARVMRPGCQADSTLVIEGAQGLGKSTALRALAEPWYTEINAGEDLERVRLPGFWIVEISDIETITKEDSTKAFLGKAHDRYRPQYGRRPRNFPRQCVFAGTTAAKPVLSPERRFWRCASTKADVEGLSAERHQLWAEALHLYEAGVAWWPVPVPPVQEEPTLDSRGRAVAIDDEVLLATDSTDSQLRWRKVEGVRGRFLFVSRRDCTPDAVLADRLFSRPAPSPETLDALRIERLACADLIRQMFPSSDVAEAIVRQVLERDG